MSQWSQKVKEVNDFLVDFNAFKGRIDLYDFNDLPVGLVNL